MNPRLLIPLLALLPWAASAQTSVFSTNFSTGERVTNNANYDAGDWTLASTKAITGISYGSGAFTFGMNATTSGLVQTQNRYTATPATISNVGEWIELKVRFTNTSNLLAGGVGSLINLGLFDTAGNNPTAGLENSGLTATNSSPFAIGNAQLWEGYAGRLSASTTTNSVVTRPAQISDGTESSSENQELLFSNIGNGAYDYPNGATVGSTTTTLTGLTTSTQYNAVLRLTVSAPSEYTINYSLLNAAGDTTLQSISSTTAVSNFLSGLSFDGLAIGYRQASTNLATSMTLNSVEVTLNQVPEPSASILLAAITGLALTVPRRRRVP